MSEWWQDLDTLHNHIWDLLYAGAARKQDAPRLMTLATICQSGGAQARMVVLRSADRSSRTVTAHTDTLSAKVAELRTDPRATLLMWHEPDQFQVRLRCEVGIDTGAAVATDWGQIPVPVRREYGNSPPPGDLMDRPEALQIDPTSDRFAVLTCRVVEIDALKLNRSGHYRAHYERRLGWIGHWVAP